MALVYNTQQRPLILGEYGRNIQQMVDYCVTIPDREERNYCARSIIRIMGNIVPQLRDTPDYAHKLWDHLAAMSEYKLDIDWPYEGLAQCPEVKPPKKVEYGANKIKVRHYGKLIEQMIDAACKYPDGEERDKLIALIANHMKKTMLSVNKDGVDNEKITDDLRWMSDGVIDLDPSTYSLHEFKEAPVASSNKRSKKK